MAFQHVFIGIEASLTCLEASWKRLEAYWMHLGACKHRFGIIHHLKTEVFQSVCFQQHLLKGFWMGLNMYSNRLQAPLGCLEATWKRLITYFNRPQASLSCLEESWRRLEASWSLQNCSASTTPFECVLHVLESLKTYWLRLEALLSSLEAPGSVSSDSVMYILRKSSLQSVCFNTSFVTFLMCLNRLKAHQNRVEVSSSYLEASWRRLEASWMPRGACKDS